MFFFSRSSLWPDNKAIRHGLEKKIDFAFFNIVTLEINVVERRNSDWIEFLSSLIFTENETDSDYKFFVCVSNWFHSRGEKTRPKWLCYRALKSTPFRPRTCSLKLNKSLLNHKIIFHYNFAIRATWLSLKSVWKGSNYQFCCHKTLLDLHSLWNMKITYQLILCS